MLYLTFVLCLAGWIMNFMCMFAGVLSSDNSMVCFRHKVFLKSDTVAGLRRSSYLNPCLTLVLFMNYYYEYFCFWIWRAAISLGVVKSIPLTGLAQERVTLNRSTFTRARRISRMSTPSMSWPTGKCLPWHFQPLPVGVCNNNMFQADHHSPCAQEH